MRLPWCHHGANYETSSPPNNTSPLNLSQYRSSIKNPSPTPLKTIFHDLKVHYKTLDPSAAEHALVRDLVHDWSERRLLAYWKCLEHHPRRAIEIVRLMGLNFGKSQTDALVLRALGRLRIHPRKARFEVVARALQQVGNGDEVLGLEDPQFVLSCSQVVSEGLQWK